MFRSKRTPTEWMRRLRAADALTLEEARTLAAMETASQTERMLRILEEIGLRFVEIDKTMERTVPEHRRSDAPCALSEGV